MRRGTLVWVHLEGIGSEQRGFRPAIIAQNNVGNKSSPTLIIVPLTQANKKNGRLPTHVYIDKKHLGERYKNSIALTEQVRVIDKKRVRRNSKKKIPDEVLREIDKALAISLGLGNFL